MSLDENYEQYIDASTVSVMPTALRYGAIGALILIALGLLLEVTGQSEPEVVAEGGGLLNSLVLYGTIIGTVVMAIKAHRDKDLGGYISYGRSLGIGTLTSVVLGVVSAIWTFIQMSFISPDKLEQIREISIEKAIEQAGGDEAAIEATQGILDMMFTPSALALMSVLTILFVGFIISLIAGAILKKDSPGA